MIIKRYNQEIARLIPMKQKDWREKMTMVPEFLVFPEELIEPLEDIWDDI